jgi:hypothetical protein
MKTKITILDYVMACRCGEYQANKDILCRTKTKVHKSKKQYSRKMKHKYEE